ncbi:NPFF2 protein, partial [Cinclus mexicanus]|nr:NPFF2 protein [Cinclus mexicanus]
KKKMDSNSSLDLPQVLNDNGTYKFLYLERNVSCVDFYLHQPLVAAVFITSYLLIFLLCMVGSGGVCFIILWSKHMCTVTNLFILNLAVSDLLVGLFCMPTTLLGSITAGGLGPREAGGRAGGTCQRGSPFGSLVCKVSGMVQGISVSASVFTVVAIAVDRFRCVGHPFKQKLTVPMAVAIIAAIWLLAVAIMCPSAVLLQVQEEKHFQVLLGSGNATREVFWCQEEWPDQAMRRVYTTVLFANIYLAPLLLIMVMYIRISISLSHTAAPGAGKRGREQRHSLWKRKQKAIKMLVVVTLLFSLSWLPLWKLMLLSHYTSLSHLQLHLINIYIYPFAHGLAFSNSSINPIIYGFCNENFRRGFQAVFQLQLCSQPGPSNSILPAACCPAPQDQATQTAVEVGDPVKEGNWVNNQQDFIMEHFKEPCNNGIK